MKRWIRPNGLIGLTALLVLMFGSWWLLSGLLLKTAIETIGTRIVGAKVQVADANLTFAPLGFRLHRLQVTDPQKPMQNMVEIAAAAGNVEPWKLLLGHVIIDDMSADGIRFDTPRAASGALHPAAAPPVQAKKEGPAASPLNIIKQKLPSADEILQRAHLATPQRVQDLQESEKAQRAQVEQALKALPDASRLKQYQQQIQQLTGGKVQSPGDLQQRRRQLNDLKHQLRRDKAAVENARKQLETARRTLTAKFDALKQAPEQDIARIEQQYGLNALGASTVTRLLFGGQAQKWFDLIRTWYGRIARLLPSGKGAPQPARPPRGTGHYVHFHELHPLPDFLIRHASGSAAVPIGDIAATLWDVTPQPQILGRPARLRASGRGLHNAKAALVTGVFDHVNPRNFKDHVDWRISDWGFTDAHVVESDALSLTLAKALANIDGSADLIAGGLRADMKAAFHGAQWKSQAKQAWAAQLLSALSGINTFDVSGAMHGDLQSPAVSLKSDLDEKLKKAVVNNIKTRGSELQQKLRARLTAQVNRAAGPYQSELNLITQGQGTADGRGSQIDDLLKSQLQSQLKSQENKAKNKLEEKLKKGLGF